jgi:hypothetical protein
VFEAHWSEIAERIRPSYNGFQRQMNPGEKNNDRVFDSTGALALPKFASAVISMSFPATQTYHKLQSHNGANNNNIEINRYLESVNALLFRVRYGNKSNFQAQSCEVVLDVGAFGTGVLFTDDYLGKGIRYKAIPLYQVYMTEDAYGVVNTLHRKFEYTASQAAGVWGVDALPECMQQALNTNNQEKFEIIHAVYPNPDIKKGRKDFSGMAYSSLYICNKTRMVISEGGYRVFPYSVVRFETAPNEVYGRSPAMAVLPTIKTANEMMKTTIRAAQNVVAPPIMLTDDASLQAFNMRSNALNYGYVDSNGRAMAVPFETRAQVNIGVDLMNRQSEIINDAFYITLFRILVNEPQITATQAMLRAQEKGELLAPTMGRIQSDMLGPMVEREIDILSAAGELPPMPQELIDMGGEFKIEYKSPLNQAQRASEGVAIMNTFQALAPLAQNDPGVMDVFDMEAAARLIADINGMPAAVMRSKEEVAAIKENARQEQQAAQMLQAAPLAASSAKDFMQAQALAQQGGMQSPL